MDDLIAEFLTESHEGLAQVDNALVQLERNPGHGPTIALVFRIVHTIKGTCGFLGLPRLERVAHAAENVLGLLREGQLQATPALIGAVLTAIDRIKLILGGMSENGAEPAGDDSAIVQALGKWERGEANVETPTSAPAPTVPVEAAEVHEPAGGSQTIRVAVDVLENLMTLVSELVLTRNQLLQLTRGRDAQRRATETAETAALAAPLQRLSQITSDLQEGVMKTRMQPVGAAWNKLPRIVRDLSHELGKRIELIMTGAETELDRQVLELIRDPLTHMVRNSADHGLEEPTSRRAAGKAETGRITLTAFHEGGHVVIEISDDGRGLDVSRICAKAAALGLAAQADLDTMPDAQVCRFIFHPGFSTAASVTAVSGRGVGMDVVKTNIERIGGTIDLKTVPGQGTTFTIKIPLTLAIVSALIVEAAGQRFAIPQLSVVELVRTGSGDPTASGPAIERMHGTPVLRLRDRLLPLVSLEHLLQLDVDSAHAREQDAGQHVVVSQIGAASLGIIVDRVFDTEEIVVKPMAPILRHVTLFGGNTILGDGSVIMILDPVGIARASGIGMQGSRADDRRRGATMEPETGMQSHATSSNDRVAILLFRVREALMAVPLGLIARLEEISTDRIEFAVTEHGEPQAITQYRGGLMPLLPLTGELDRTRPSHPVLVFSNGADDGANGTGNERCVGLVVDAIVDVVEEQLRVQLSGQGAGIMGTAVIAGRAAGVLDTRHWLTRAHQGWFREARREARGAPRVLVVEDSSFFRQLLLPVLSTAGYAVTAASNATQALALRDEGRMFDAIVSDVEMPEMDGLAFARAVRSGGAWSRLPMVALSARFDPADVEAGRAAGFTDYIAKFEQDTLLVSLRQCIEHAGLVRVPTDA